MMGFRVWDPLNYERPESVNMQATCHEQAAIGWVESRWSDLDYRKAIDVIAEDEDGLQRAFVVTAEPTVEFHAASKP